MQYETVRNFFKHLLNNKTAHSTVCNNMENEGIKELTNKTGSELDVSDNQSS